MKFSYWLMGWSCGGLIGFAFGLLVSSDGCVS